MKQFFKTSTTLLVAMLLSVVSFGQSADYSQKKQSPKVQQNVTQDVLTNVAHKNITPTNFDYTSVVTTDAAKDVIWDNGPLLTNVGAGFEGADLSAVQSELGMTSSGGGFQIIQGFTLADDFVITEYTSVESINFFAYQTGSGTTSTINKVYYQIWDGDPSAGGTVIYGDLATNRLVSTDWTNMYRAADINPLNSDRPIMNILADATGLYLTAGTYWVEVQADGSASSGPWCPEVTILGVTTTGNALQNNGTWGIWEDSGTLTQQGMPFIINGTSAPQAANDLSVTEIISPVSGNELGMETVTVLIRNLGTNDQSNFDVSFAITNNATVVETVTETIPSNGSLEYTFTATADLSIFGDYTVDVCSLLADDEYPDNDCITEIVSSMDIEIISVYPQMEAYWTGSTDGTTKTETSLSKALGDVEEGWMKFDVTEIPVGAAITEIVFHGYVYDANYPFWSITPLKNDPITTDAATLYDEIMAGTPEANAYSYNDEGEDFGIGWHEYVLTDFAKVDLAGTIEQGWFAVGCGGRDNNDTYFALFEGWNETNVPYLEVSFNVAGQAAPTDLTAEVSGEDIVLNWMAPAKNVNSTKDLIGYNLYYSFDGSDFELLAENIAETTYTDVDQTAPGAHTYYVTAVYDDGESFPSNEAEILISSVEEHLANNVTIYPNPATEFVKIKSTASIEQIEVYNQLGQRVKLSSTNCDMVNISDLKAGIYFMKIFSSNKIITKKLEIK